jgi:hypothetical protein
MPRAMSMLLLSALSALVVFQSAPARAQQDALDDLFPPSIALNGVFGAVSLGSDEAPSFAAPGISNARSGVWNGASWLTAWSVPTLPRPGIPLRTSGIVGSFMTERLGSVLPGHDGVFHGPAVMTLDMPAAYMSESRTWSLMLAGFLVMTAIVRRHLRQSLPD